MHVDVITTRETLVSLRDEWEQLPRPSAMQSADWLLAWWDAYGEGRELTVVVVRDEGQLIGLAPWYAETKRGVRRLRWLGDGRACSDHTTLLCAPGRQDEVADAIAEWMAGAPASEWSQLTLDSVDDDDAVVHRMIDQLADLGCPVSRRDEPGSCYVNLPESWEAYLASVSKNHRKKLRRMERKYFATGLASVQVFREPKECFEAFDLLVQMHNDRREALGEEGVFEDPQFLAFHRSAIDQLAASGRLELRILSVDNKPVASEYLLKEGANQFAYQGGLSAAGEEVSAGALSMIAMIQDAIAAGYRQLDLLRGVEPYKFSWGAIHRPAQTVCIRRPSAAGHAGAWCDTIWKQAKQVKRRLVSAQ